MYEVVIMLIKYNSRGLWGLEKWKDVKNIIAGKGIVCDVFSRD